MLKFVTALIPAVVWLIFFSGRNAGDKFLRSSEPVGKVYIIIDKSDYSLYVYDDLGWFATYPVVFGSKDQRDKYMEGDKRTPEGKFKILSKRPHNKWNKFLHINYPNEESWRKFKERKQKGLIASTAKIGGGIGIHGTWPNDNIVVDDYTNWTNGCISLKNHDLNSLYSYIPIGTEVTIRK